MKMSANVVVNKRITNLKETRKNVKLNAWEIWKIEVPAFADTSQFRGDHYYMITCNEKGGMHSQMVWAIPFTSKKATLPTHISILHDFEQIGLVKPSTLSVESMHQIDKKWLNKKVGCMTNEYVREKIRAALLDNSGLFH